MASMNFFKASSTVILLCLATVAFAQQPTVNLHADQISTLTTRPTRPPSPTTLQRSLYQTQGELPVLPGLPPANFNAGVPAMPAGLQNGAVLPPATGLPSNISNNQTLGAASVLPRPPIVRDPMPGSPAGSYGVNPTASNVAASNSMAGYPGVTNNVPANYSTFNNTVQTITEPEGFPATQANPSGLRNPQDIATGYPHVSPPPRTGRYPTSPYLGPRLQPTSYSQNTLSSPYRPIAYQTTGDPADRAPVLPPNQPVVGVYPSSSQPGFPSGSPQNFPQSGAVPGTFTPNTITPNMAPNLYPNTSAGLKPLVSLGQQNYNVQLGRGIIGQPTAYVPGQPVRNFLRYFSP